MKSVEFTVPHRKCSGRLQFPYFHGYPSVFCQYTKSKEILLSINEHDICGQANSVLISPYRTLKQVRK